MKLRFLLLCSLLAGAIAQAQQTVYDPNVAARTMPAFHAIEISGGIDLLLSNGEPALAVSARETSIRDHIRTEVRNGVLHIWYDWKEGKNRFREKQLRAYVSCRDLDSLKALGGCAVKVAGMLSATKLYLVISSGSNFKGRIEASELHVEQNAGSDSEISGKAASLTMRATSGSDVNAYELMVDHGSIEARSGSDIQITVNKEINAEASGGSDINWKGSATVRKARASGGGSVAHRS